MQWDAIAAIGQAVGAVAVVVSLLYLAAQVRQNTGAVHAATADSKLGSAMEVMRMVIEDGDVARIVRIGFDNPSALSENDRLRFFSLVTFNLMAAETSHYHHRKGTLDSQLWESTRAKFIAFIGMPGPRIVWQARRARYSARFQEYVDSLLSEPHPEGLTEASGRVGEPPVTEVEAGGAATKAAETSKSKS